MFRFVSRFVVASGAAALTLLVAGGAFALPQFDPTPTALLHTLPSTEPGVSYNSGGLGSGGQIAYTNLGGGNGSLNIISEIDVLNYYDPANGSCATNVGSNCSYNFGLMGGQNLDFEVNANLLGVNVTAIPSTTIVQIDIMFESAGNGDDFVWTDPLDGDSDMLSAVWTAGLFNGNPTSGLQAQVFFDTNTMTALGDVNVTGFATIQSGHLASMFGADHVAIHLSTFFDFSPSFAAITQGVIDTGEIPSFTAEIQGQIFRADSGEFVPEPGTALLLGVGLLGLGSRRSRRAR